MEYQSGPFEGCSGFTLWPQSFEAPSAPPNLHTPTPVRKALYLYYRNALRAPNFNPQALTLEPGPKPVKPHSPKTQREPGPSNLDPKPLLKTLEPCKTKPRP